MTLAQLIDEALPRLLNPTMAAFAYWREQLGDVRLSKLEAAPHLIALHLDRLLGARCYGYGHKTTKARKPATVRNYAIELSRLFSFAITELRVMETNPCARVTKPRASTNVVRFLSDHECAALLQACKASDSPDLYPFVMFSLTTGCRKNEAATLEWAQCDLRRRWAIFPRTKNGDSRGVPLTTAVCALLAARKRESARVFPTDITRAWHTAIARAGVADFRFHDLRHSCASRLVQNGANLVEIATLLGHRGLQMAARYAHISNTNTSRLVDRVMGDIA